MNKSQLLIRENGISDRHTIASCGQSSCVVGVASFLARRDLWLPDMSNLSTPIPSFTSSFPASITSSFNYLPTEYPIQWSSAGHGTYIEHARSCWTAYTDWRTASSDWAASILRANVSYRTTEYFSNKTFYIPASTTVWPTTSVSTYTLCDGTPRAEISPYTSHYISLHLNERPIIQTIGPPGHEAPEPSCTFNVDDCAVYFFQSNLGYYQEDTNITKFLLGQCGFPVDWPGHCLIQGGPAQLIYFPLPLTIDSVCGRRGTEVFATTTTAPPASVTTLGRTFAADSVYISFDTIYAGFRSYDAPGGAGIQIGPTFTNAIFSFHSSEISTNCFGTINPTATTTAGFGYGTRLNFADLNAPVPAAAYACQNQCQRCFQEDSGDSRGYTTRCNTPDPCPTIWDNFNPLLAVPTRFREIVPEWSSCSFWDDRHANLIFDPPIALHTAESVATASLPSWEISSPASGPASVPAVVTPTALPDVATAPAPTPAPSSTFVVAAPTAAGDTFTRVILADGSTFLGIPTSIDGTGAVVIVGPTPSAGNVDHSNPAVSQTLFPGSSIALGGGGGASAAIVIAENTSSTSQSGGNMGSHIVDGLGGTTTQLPGPTTIPSTSQSTSATSSVSSAGSSTVYSARQRWYAPVLTTILTVIFAHLYFI